MRLPIRGWKKTLSALGLRIVEDSERKSRKRRRTRHSPLESLEARHLMATDIAIGGFTSNNSQLIVEYSVGTQAASAFDVNVYRSSDGTSLDALVGTTRITDSGQLAVGTGYTASITANFTDVPDDYVLIAVVDAASENAESSEANNKANFASGVFQSADGVVHVHGTSSTDTITISQGTQFQVQLNSEPVIAFPLVGSTTPTAFHVHAQGGGDTINATNIASRDTWLFGGAGADSLQGGAGNDKLAGGGGDDTLTGNSGDDTYIFSGTTDLATDSVVEAVHNGSDTLDFSGINFPDLFWGIYLDLSYTDYPTWVAGNYSGATIVLDMSQAAGALENVIGSQYADYIYGNSLTNRLEGGGDSDYLAAGLGGDTLVGGTGDDAYDFYVNGSGNFGTATIVEAASEGTDWIYLNNLGYNINAGVTFDLGSASAAYQIVNQNGTSLVLNLSGAELENVYGTNYDDVLTGNARDNYFYGGSGNDTYKFVGDGEQGTDEFGEGGGTDTLDFSQLDLGTGVSVNLAGTSNQQVISAGGKQLTLKSLAGIENAIGTAYGDTLTGSTLNNRLEGGLGDDTLAGGSGNDTFAFSGSIAAGINLGQDAISDSAGTDTLDFSGLTTGSTTGVVVDLNQTSAQTIISQASTPKVKITLASATTVENVIGTSANDTLSGNSLNNTLQGGAGDDTYFYAQTGSLGTDTIVELAGGGTDTLDFWTLGDNVDAGVTVNLSAASTSVINTGGTSLSLNLSASPAIENINGTDYADTLIGNALDNTLYGNDGNDALYGSAGSDTLYGGDGDDTLQGSEAPLPGGVAPEDLADGLIAYWKFDDQPGQAIDSAGESDFVGQTASVPGRLGQAAYFAGDAALNPTSSNALGFGKEDFTTAGWVWFNSTTSKGLWGKGNAGSGSSTQQEWVFYLDSGQLKFLASNGSTSGTAVGPSLTTGRWYYLVGWYDATQEKLFVQVDNGTPTSATYTAGPSDRGNSFYLAESLQQVFAGKLDGIGVWDRTLSTDERTALYNAGAGTDLLWPVDSRDVLSGGEGNDTLDGGLDIDSISGGVGVNDPRIVDDADFGTDPDSFDTTGDWTSAAGNSFLGHQLAIESGSGENTATWTFTNLPSGDYDVFGTWTPTEDAATDATFELKDDTSLAATAVVDQTVRPGFNNTTTYVADARWKKLGTVTIASGTLVVTLSDDADGTVLADAIRITPAADDPDTFVTPLVGGERTVSEGLAYTLTLNPSGGGGDEWRIEWGDGTIETYPIVAPQATHIYSDGSTAGTARTILASMVHGNVLTDAAPFTIAVNNVRPGIELVADPSVGEGSSYTVSLVVADPGDDTVSQWTINWGDGSDPETFDGDETQVSHVYADGAATRYVTASVTDEDGSYDMITSGSAGELDSQTFGPAGKVTTDFGGGDDYARAAVLDSEGRIISIGVNAANDFILSRHLSDGTLDPSFGTAGRVQTDFSPGSLDSAFSVAIDGDGRIIVVGDSNYKAAVVRYLSDGSLDTSFDSDGKRTIAVGGGHDRALDVLAIGDQILVSGFTQGSSFDAFVLRLNEDGSTDTGFGSSGVRKIDFAGYDDAGLALAQLPDGRIVVASQAGGASTGNFGVALLTSSGALDTTFDSDGKYQIDIGSSTDDYATDVAVFEDNDIYSIVLTGTSTSGSNQNFALARITFDDDDNDTFTVPWKVSTDFSSNTDNARGLVLLDTNADDVPDRAVAAGRGAENGYGSNFALARYSLSDGSLDTAFDGDGKLVTDFSGRDDRAEDLLVDSEGELLVLGESLLGQYYNNYNFVLARYSATGVLDHTFGRGRVDVDFGQGDDGIGDVAHLPDGRIIVVGGGDTQDFQLAQYLPDGTLDPTFGNGTGKVQYNWGNYHEGATDLAIQPDGKIIVAGLGRIYGTDYDWALSRFNADGSIDTSFGTNGRASLIVDYDNYLSALQLLPDGSILAGGFTYNTSNSTIDMTVVKFTSAGVLDTSFGTSGKYVLAKSGTGDQINDFAVLGDGSIILVGSGGSDLLLAKLSASGVLDTSFGTSGKTTLSIGGGASGMAAVVLDNKLYVGGIGNFDFLLARFNLDGTLDTSFDPNSSPSVGPGWQAAGFPYSGAAYDLLVDRQGKLVLVGSSVVPGSTTDFAIARYNADGTLDTSFDSDGKKIFDFGGDNDIAYAVSEDSYGRYVISGSARPSPYANANFALIRVLSGHDGLMVNVNDVAPIVTLDGDGEIAPDSAYDVTLNFDDAGDDALTSWTINWGDGSSTQTFDDEETEVSHTYEIEGEYSINVTVTNADSQTYTFNDLHRVTVVASSLPDDNGLASAPTLTSIPPQVLTVGAALSVPLQAVYPGGDLADVVFASVTGNPTGVTIDPDESHPGQATLHWTPVENAPEGTYLINVDVWDSNDPQLATRSIIHVLLTSNEAPVLSSVDDQTVTVGNRVSLTLAANDPDGSNLQLRYGLGEDAPAGVHVNSVSGVLSWQPTTEDIGDHTFDVVVRDNGRPSLTDTQTVTIHVLAANVAPTISAPATVTLDEDDDFEFGTGVNVIEVADTDSSGSDLELSIVATNGQFVLGSTTGLVFQIGDSGNDPAGVVKFRGTATELNTALDGLTFTPNANHYGYGELRLELSDLGNGGTQRPAFATKTIALAITQQIDDPAIANQTLHAYFTSDPIQLVGAVLADNPDPNQLLTYEITADASGAFAINAATGRLTLTNRSLVTAGNDYNITVHVFYENASTHEDDATVTIRVEASDSSAQGNSYSVAEDDSVSGNVLTDGTDDASWSSPVVVAAYDHGTALVLGVPNRLVSGATFTLNSDGTFTYDAATSSQFDKRHQGTSSDEITYQIANATGAVRSAQTSVSFTINHVNDLHVVPDQTFALAANPAYASVIGKLLVVHSESDESLSYSIASDNTEDLFQIDSSGNLKFVGSTPPTEEDYELEIDVTDSLSRTVTATVDLVVMANAVPVAPTLTYQTPEDVPLVGNVLSDNTGAGAAHDPNVGQTLAVVSVNGRTVDVDQTIRLVSGATLTVNADGSFVYDPSSSLTFNRLRVGQSANEVIRFAVRDDYGTETSSSFVIHVQGRNDAPIARSNAYEVRTRSTIAGNLVSDVDSAAGLDADLDSNDHLLVVAADGTTVDEDGVEVITAQGATVIVHPDGSFTYDPATITGFGTFDPGDRLYDSLVYTIEDVSGATSTAVARFTIVIDSEVITPGIDVTDFGLVNDTGTFEDDHGTEDPRVQGTLVGDHVDADHIVIEFDLTVDNYTAALEADEELELDDSTTGYPDFEFDPSSSVAFSTVAEHKIIAYRTTAYDSGSAVLAQSIWHYFDFDLLDPDDAGPRRLSEGVRLYHDTNVLIDEEHPGQLGGAGHSGSTSDPRLFGVIQGDFDSKTVRVEFTHSRNGNDYTGHIDLTEPGSFIYDPRTADPGLADITSGTFLTVTYQIGTLDGSEDFETPLIADDDISFTYIPMPGAVGGIASLVEVTNEQSSFAGTTRTVRGTVASSKQDSVYVEFDYSDTNGDFDGEPDGETTATRDTTSYNTANDSYLTFQYTAVGLVGTPPKIKARVREWSPEDGDYRYSGWTSALELSSLQAPRIDHIETNAVHSGRGETPEVTGYLEGATSANTSEQYDLSKLANVTIEFFHDEDPGENTVPDGTTLTDAQGHFSYTPRGLHTGTNNIYARSAVTIPGSSNKVYSQEQLIYLNVSEPDWPVIVSNSFKLVDEEDREYVSFHWVTDDPQFVGKLRQDVTGGVPVGQVYLEFAHDDPNDSEDNDTVDGYATPSADGTFNYTPVGLEAGDVRIRARVAYYDPVLGTTFHENSWTNYDLHVEAQTNSAATVADLGLVNVIDDEEDPVHTTDPTLSGHVEDAEGYVAHVIVEFRDHTSQAILGATTTDAGGNFTYALTGLATGTYTIDARVQDWDYINHELVYGAWTSGDDSLTFVLDEPAPLEVDTFGLHSDTGDEQDDDLTANPLLWGKIEGDGALGGVLVAIDMEDDDTIDAVVKTDADGIFSYDPVALELGEHSARARVMTWNAATGEYDYTTGVTAEFELEEQENAPAKLVEFALASDDSPVTDPTLVGRIINEDVIKGITIEFDYNNDGTVDQSTTTEALGRFRFTPDLPSTGSVGVRARTRELDTNGAQWLVSSWSTALTFNYQPDTNDVPVIQSVLVDAQVDDGPPPVTNNPGLYGYVTNDGSTTDLVMEFSYTENGPVFTTANVYSGAYSATFTGLIPGETYTVWVRAKEPLPNGSVQYSEAQSATFTVDNSTPSGIRLSEFALLHDTATIGGSTDHDGSTSNVTLTGTVAGIEEVEDVTIQFDFDGNGSYDATTTTDENGDFTYTPTITEPGLHSIRARATTVTNGTSNWYTLNFVYDTNDSSAAALALVQAFSTIDAHWQTTDNFDDEFGSSVADDLYDDALAHAGSTYDFNAAVAELNRRTAQQSADDAYATAQQAAQAAYQTAVASAQSDFLSALANLPEHERATYTLKDFAWPDAPADNAFVFPSNSAQPQAPTAPNYDGPTFDYTRDPVYQTAAAQAKQTFFSAQRTAEEDYYEDVQDANNAYDDEVETAQETYRDAIEEAQADYADDREDRPEFDQEAYDALAQEIRDAWDNYYKIVNQNSERYVAITYDSGARLTAERQHLDQQKQDAKASAYDAIFGDDYEHPSEGSVDDVSPYPIDIGTVILHRYTRGADHDYTTQNSPPEQSAYVLAAYQIDKDYAPRYEQAANEDATRIENAQRDRDVANAEALQTTLGTIYQKQRAMAQLSRDFQHDELEDRLNDDYSYAEALANAQEELQHNLATAQQTRAQAIADAGQTRDYAVAGAQRTHDQSVATAKLTATQTWAAQVGTLWANYQVQLAGNQNTYEQQIANLALTRDQARADAVWQQAYDVADAEKARADAVATAERDRTVGLADGTRDFRVAADDEYEARDNDLADAWYDRRIAMAEAAKTYQITIAEISAQYDIADAEATNAYSTALVWAYEVSEYHWYGDPPTIVVDNTQTRQDLFDTRKLQWAENNRDRHLATADTAETYDADRIQAVEDYRKDSNQLFHDTADEVAALHATYQTNVGQTQDDFNFAIVSAAADYAVDIATAEAAHSYKDIAADSAFSLSEAPLGKTHSVSDAVAKKNYEVTEANNYVSVLNAWAGGSVTPWEAYQKNLANAQKTFLSSVGAADVARASNLANQNITWTQSAIAADLAYAVTLYGGVNGGGEYVARAETIAAAHVTSATVGSLAIYVADQAEAVKTHDQNVADKNLTFYDTLAEIDAVRDLAVSHAQHEQERDEARAYFEYDKPNGIEDYTQLYNEAHDRNVQAVAEAGRDRAIAAAEARRTWTYDVGVLNVTLVTDLVGAQTSLADRRQTEIIDLATAVAHAQSDYEITDAGALKTQIIAYANADQLYENAAANIEADYATSLTATGNVKSNANAASQGTYEVALYTGHANQLASVYTADPTSLGLYQKLTAAADVTWATARANARNAYYQALAPIEVTLTTARNAADISQATRSSAANKASTVTQAETDRALSVAMANADADLYIAQKTAEAHLIVGVADAHGTADIAYADTVRVRDNASADASVVWVTTVANASVQYQTEGISYEQYQQVVKQADKTRVEAERAAAKVFRDALDDLAVDVTAQIGEARIEYVEDTTSAQVDHVSIVNQAQEGHAITSANSDNVLTVKLTQYDKDRQAALLVADYSHTLSVSNRDVIFAEALAGAGISRATSRATAEAGYALTQAQAEMDNWQDLSQANPSSGTLHFKAAQSAAFADWIESMQTPFVTYSTALAAADGQQSIDITTAQATQAASEAIASKDYGITIAETDRVRAIRLVAISNASGIAAVKNEDVVALKVAEANAKQAMGHAEAQVKYDSAISAITGQFLGDFYYSHNYYGTYWGFAYDPYFYDYYNNYDRTNSEAAQQAQRDAVADRDKAFADADFDWRLDMSEAEYEYAIAEASRESQALVKEAAIEKNHALATADAEALQEIANAQAEAQNAVDLTVAENTQHESTVLATANLQSAQYEAKVDAMDLLIADLPKADGQVHGIAIGYETGNLTFTANLWNGSSDTGEFSVSGSSLTEHTRAGGTTDSLGTLNKGIAVDDSATGTGYIMYSSQSVHTRFSSHAPNADNSDHLIAVRYDAGSSQWQYNNDSGWYVFTPTSSDLLIAEIDFDIDLVGDLGGNAPWADFQKSLAQGEATAWEAVKADYLQWQADISAARLEYASDRANEQLESATIMANASEAYSTQTADAAESRIAQSAAAQRDYATKFADTVVEYRTKLSQAEYTRAIGVAEAIRTSTSPSPVTEQFDDDKEAAEDAYLETAAQLIDGRNAASAAIHANFVINETTARINRTTNIRNAERDFVTATADLYFDPESDDGLQQQIADLNFDYESLEAENQEEALEDLASDEDTPWANYTSDEFEARSDNLLSVELDSERDRELALAEAERNYSIAINQADYNLAESTTNAQATRERLIAAATAGYVAVHHTSLDSGDLPADLTPPIPDLGQVTIVNSDYELVQPGSVRPAWYYDYFGAGYTEGNFHWSWGGDAVNSYYYDDYGRYSYGWGYEGWAGDYVSYSVGTGTWGSDFGYYYGGWGYNPGYYAYGGWSPSYVNVPTSVPGNTTIDPKAELANYDQELANKRDHLDEPLNDATEEAQQSEPPVNLTQGDVDVPPAADPPPVEVSIKVLSDEQTGWTYQGMWEEYLTQYGDDGLALFAFVARKGWDVKKESYGWVTVRHDWWLDEGDLMIAIGDTDWGGISYRTNANAAAQLHDALLGVVAHENWLQEIKLMMDGYAKLPWHKKIYRTFQTSVGASFIGEGIKNVENAIVGRTITDQKIEGWDRLKLGVVGSIQTLLVAVPAGGLVVAAGSKIGLGALVSAKVRDLMAADILLGFGKKTVERLVVTRAGQGFLRAYTKVYAKVYNSKLNIAIVGTKQELGAAAEGAIAAESEAVTAESEAALVESRLAQDGQLSEGTASSPKVSAPDLKNPGNRGASSQALAESRAAGIELELTADQRVIQRTLLEEHPGLSERVAAEASRNGVSAAGAGGEGGDVLLINGTRREVSVHIGAFNSKSIGTHLGKEASQRGTEEIFLQINTAGATQEELLQMLLGREGLRSAYSDLSGKFVRFFGPNGESWWSGIFR